jgi:hypothetical protein
MERLDGDAAGREPSVQLLELGDALADFRRKSGRWFHVVEDDL